MLIMYFVIASAWCIMEAAMDTAYFSGQRLSTDPSLTKVLQLNCKTQLMERDALDQQHVTQCCAIALIKSRRSLLVVSKTTG